MRKLLCRLGWHKWSVTTVTKLELNQFGGYTVLASHQSCLYCGTAETKGKMTKNPTS